MVFFRAIFPERWPFPKPFTAILPIALSIAVSSWVALDRSKDFISHQFSPPPPRCQGDTFDYIIVGGGTAGIVVATRIANATFPSARILLLEAGGEPPIFNNVPAFDLYLLHEEANAWIYNSTPQQFSCGACDDRKSITTRGKMLGGSSQLNFMYYVRGNKEDFNRWQWEDAEGDPQWSYPELLPYFKKSEDYHGAYKDDPQAQEYHGKGGLLNVGTYDFMPGADQLLAAAREKGYPIGDYNGAKQDVFHLMDMTTQDGWRESTYRAFYKDTGKPPNLCIRKFAHVTKLLFSFEGKPKAVGVTYTKFKKEYTVKARKEIILSAGAIGSPKLLLLSGVGPEEDLKEMNIPVVMNLPVGKNMQDHTYSLVGPFLKSPAINVNFDSVPQIVTDFLFKGRGVMAAPASVAGGAFFQSPYASPAYPDLQISQFSAGLYPELPQNFNYFLGLNETILDRWFHPYHLENRDARFILLWLGRPKSFGYLKLASRNPDVNPILEPRYLEHEDDAEALLYGFKKVVDLFENTKALNTPYFQNILPGCEAPVFKSDEYYRCVIRQFAGSFYHHVGTCALGKVVDNALRVKGIDGLRVVDASIIPRTPNGNTQAATIMVAEKGADMIVEDFNG
ncbi:unnamed protein product [Orchesella dallaii]|uniref:Glucose-methanol-choline oxidoreductase N-terminal domain-containing protein n=1 Tax=Orchesella dallaii TaxID=48710 RepID=A0ABP1S7B5_9HEXA